MGRIDQLLTFLDHPQAPYDNNGSERAVRNRVIHRKVTGGFRTIEGARQHDIIASVIETAKRQGQNVFDHLLFLLRHNQTMLST
jgi:transposase